jgi:pimeloyl-ACP methyl ester carboxylesterase
MKAVAAALRVRRFQGHGVGMSIVADEAGPLGAPPVILLHGGGQTRAAWGGAVAEGARRGFHMLSADLRGHGESGWSADADYTLEAHAADIAAIAASLGRPPFVVGASLGGLAGLAYAASGGALAGLVLVDIAPTVEAAGADKVLAFMNSAPDGFASLDEAADAVAAYLPHRPRPKDSSGLMRNLRWREDGRLRWHWDPRLFSEGRGPKDTTTGLRAAARGLRAPALLVRGRHSDVLSQAGADDFLYLCPHAEFTDIAGADHMVAGDRNDAFNAAAFDFLERHSDKHIGRFIAAFPQVARQG